jgi:hypothetical protein
MLAQYIDSARLGKRQPLTLVSINVFVPISLFLSHLPRQQFLRIAGQQSLRIALLSVSCFFEKIAFHVIKQVITLNLHVFFGICRQSDDFSRSTKDCLDKMCTEYVIFKLAHQHSSQLAQVMTACQYVSIVILFVCTSPNNMGNPEIHWKSLKSKRNTFTSFADEVLLILVFQPKVAVKT